MHLTRIALEEFRSYRRLVLDVDPRGLRIVGPNASGKSSLLEAIAMLATTRSPRSTAEREVIHWGSGSEFGVPPFARVHGDVVRNDGAIDVEIALQIDPTRPASVRKQIKVSGRPVRALDAVGRLRVVYFSPEDVALVGGPPSVRRRYLDLAISQIDRNYLRALARFARVLEQRNSLLKTLQRERASATAAETASQLAFWDDSLVASGAEVLARRQEIVTRLSALAERRFALLSSQGRFELSYDSSFPLPEPDAPGKEGAGAAAIAARSYAAELAANRADEIRRGATLLGPHRDDLALRLDGADLGRFGSRGQQRLAVVALKLAEIDLMTETTRDAPVLLLDDVLSELDRTHRALLVDVASGSGAQIVVTSTEESDVGQAELRRLPRVSVQLGTAIRDLSD